MGRIRGLQRVLWKVFQRSKSCMLGRWEDRNVQILGKGFCKRELIGVQEGRCVLEVQVIGMEFKVCGRVMGIGKKVLVNIFYRSRDIVCFRIQVFKNFFFCVEQFEEIGVRESLDMEVYLLRLMFVWEIRVIKSFLSFIYFYFIDFLISVLNWFLDILKIRREGIGYYRYMICRGGRNRFQLENRKVRRK